MGVLVIRLRSYTVLGLFLGIPVMVGAQDGRNPGEEPLSESALAAVKALFSYDATVPIDAVELGTVEVPHGLREGFVISGVRGDRVPGYLAIPTSGSPPYQLVLLMHAGAFSKDDWWSQDYFGGRPVTDDLLQRGFAVLALDAQYHGARSHNIDHRPIRSIYFEFEWFGRVRDLYFESIGDYRRALDYLASDERLDVRGVAVIGHSAGGIMALGLAAVDSRVATVVAGVAALSEPWLYPITATNLAPAVSVPVLLLAGRADPLMTVEQTEALRDALAGPVELRLYDAGHQLPVETAGPTTDWIARYMAAGR